MSLILLEEYIENGNIAAMDNLLNSNPSLVNHKTSHGMSPLLLTCYYNKPQLTRIVMKHLNAMTIHEASAIGLYEDVVSMLKFDPSLLEVVSDHGFTPLGMATHFGKVDIVRYLLTHNADPNQASQNGYQVYPLHAAIAGNHLAIAKLLVEGGAEVNVFQAARITPLHLAAQQGNIDVIILLLENGAMVDVKNDFGLTASDLAIERGHTEIGNILKS